MSTIDILILAIVLSIDACVVSFSNGLIFTNNKRANSLMLAFSVGFFQFLMPIIGYFLAQSVNKYVEPYDHWIVFGIFILLGFKFIKDAFKKEKTKKIDCYLCFSYIFLVSIATSIDALGAGVSIAFTKTPILLPAIIIGIITFINSLLGFWSGYLFKKFPIKNLEITGGVVLILLAFKVLFESIS
ncbi:MAG: manganese efflux pump [Candidatus Gastranaerophilales bacterium]|nr:manganese efflux pump [Candidatus Gastranaerophilales bacterium]